MLRSPPMPPDTPVERIYLTTAEVAEYLRVSLRTLEGWRRRRVGPPWSRLEGQVRYDLHELEAFMEANRVEPQRAAGG